MSIKMSKSASRTFPVELRPSRRYALLRLFPWWLLVAALLSLSLLTNNFWFISLVPALLVMLFKYLSFTFIRYFISSETIKVRRGIFSRRLDYLEWFRVKDYQTTQTVAMRLLGVMEVRLYTTDLTNDVVTLEAVPQSDLPELIRDLVIQARLNNRIFEIN